MPIKSNNPIAPTLILSSDTTLLNPAANVGRASVTFANFHEQTGVSETIELFISTDATSAAGERIDIILFAADETKQPVSALITVAAGSFLIAKGTVGSLVECNLSYTQYSGDS